MAMGISSTSSGTLSIALGYNTTSSGYGSLAAGFSTIASNNYSSAMGYTATASGLASTAIGYRTIASESYSTALGYGNKAYAVYATSLGSYSYTYGNNSMAIGNRVNAYSYGETALGMYNTIYSPVSATTPSPDDRLLVVGNGSKVSRSDAMVILKNGSIGMGTSTPASTTKLSVYGTNADKTNISIYTEASGGEINSGIRAYATGTETTNYGIYAYASGATNNYAGYFNGNVTVTGTFANPSDSRYKTNIEKIENSLDKIMLINGVRFDWRSDEFPDMNFGGETQIGVIAQEVEKVLPELVFTDENGYKSVSYEKLTPVLIEAIKEQQEEVEALKTENEKLKNRINAIEELLSL